MKRDRIKVVNPFEYMELTTQAQKVYHMWQTIGGSFVQGLAQALLHADPINMKKIHDTWETEWNMAVEQYNKYDRSGDIG